MGNPRVKIETVKIGGRRYVGRAAVARFVARLTCREAEQSTATVDQRGEFQVAVRELEADGIV